VTEEMAFFLWLIESYAAARGRSAGDVLREWDEKGMTQEVFDGWWQYHQERIENAFADIDSLAAAGVHAGAN